MSQPFRTIALVLIFVATLGFAQDAPTFKADSELVVVDVVVTNRSGEPVRGLKASDLTVFEDCKQRPIAQFEAHDSNSPTAKPPSNIASATPLPQNTYTNSIPLTTERGLNIIFVDTVNTTLQSQQFAREQLIKLAKQLPPGTPVAVFAMVPKEGSVLPKLELKLQPTTSKDLVLRVAETIETYINPFFNSDHARQITIGRAAYASYVAGRKVGVGSASQDDERTDLQRRIDATLTGIRSIVGATAGFPGRKNLFWLSDTMPVGALMFEESRRNKFATDQANAAVADREFSEIGRELAKARIAVYPIETRGTTVNGIDLALAAGETSGVFAQNPGAEQLLRPEAERRMEDHSAMRRMADATGGRAFIGQNDLSDAFMRGLNEGSTYYTLAFKPSANPKEPFHDIDVHSSRQDIKLAYRRGYYSELTTPKIANLNASLELLSASLANDIPVTRLTMRVGLRREGFQQIRIEYVVDSAGVTFVDTEDHKKRAVLDFMAVVFDSQGRELQRASDTLEATIKASELGTVLRNGLPARQTIQLPPDAHILAVGAIDRTSGNVGTLRIQVARSTN